MSSPQQFGTIITVTLPADPRVEQTWAANTDIDTDTKGMCDGSVSSITIVSEPGGQDHKDEYCVIAGKSISIETGATLRAYGSKPLILLSSSTFNLQGTIDVSSHHDGTDPKSRGAGAMASCMGTTLPTGNSGGFGGSFGGTGGNGGVASGAVGEIMGTAAPALTAFPTSLRGGCPGGDGSSTTPGVTPAGGIGGGAVLIIAESLQINGTINASGAGGHAGPANESGAGGGGSGGMIVIDVVPEAVTPGTRPIQLFSNGGGGGQGGTGTGLGAGAGDDGGESLDPLTAGAGGKNTLRSGGSGGIGSAAFRNDGVKAGSASNSGGGGAGGGAAGFIYTPPIEGASISPLVTLPHA